jgi:hypothetical protein
VLLKLLFLLLTGAAAATPTATPTRLPAWDREPAAYRKVPIGTAYADMQGRILLTRCRPDSKDHEQGERTCESSGFQSNGASVDDVFFFQDDVFVGVTMSFVSDDYERLREVFLAKYGEPTRLETTRISTRTGTRFDNETLNWDGGKVSVSLQRYGESLENGSATLFLNSYLEEQEKQRREKLKRDADAF